MGRFADQTVVITGASRGLGRAMALAFADEGAHVYVGYRIREDDAENTRETIEAAGGAATIVQLDVRDRRQLDTAIKRITRERTSLDVLITIAAISRDSLFLMMNADDWQQVIDVNLTGTFNACKAVVRPMMRAGRGVIVNVASIAGPRASPGQANYAASKSAVVAFTRTLAAELAPRGIRVNALVPGLFEVGMAARMDHRVLQSRREQIPLGRFGKPEEAARVAVFLASADASYMVGQAVVVDGGLTL